MTILARVEGQQFVKSHNQPRLLLVVSMRSPPFSPEQRKRRGTMMVIDTDPAEFLEDLFN
jgi:hypothetical protein